MSTGGGDQRNYDRWAYHTGTGHWALGTGTGTVRPAGQTENLQGLRGRTRDTKYSQPQLQLLFSLSERWQGQVRERHVGPPLGAEVIINLHLISHISYLIESSTCLWATTAPHMIMYAYMYPAVQVHDR